MAKNFRTLQAKMPPETRRRAEAKAEAMLRSMSLCAMRDVGSENNLWCVPSRGIVSATGNRPMTGGPGVPQDMVHLRELPAEMDHAGLAGYGWLVRHPGHALHPNERGQTHFSPPNLPP